MEPVSDEAGLVEVEDNSVTAGELDESLVEVLEVTEIGPGPVGWPEMEPEPEGVAIK